MNRIERMLCSWGLHKMTEWQEDPVAPWGFGRFRRHCSRCPKQEAKN